MGRRVGRRLGCVVAGFVTLPVVCAPCLAVEVATCLQPENTLRRLRSEQVPFQLRSAHPSVSGHLGENRRQRAYPEGAADGDRHAVLAGLGGDQPQVAARLPNGDVAALAAQQACQLPPGEVPGAASDGQHLVADPVEADDRRAVGGVEVAVDRVADHGAQLLQIVGLGHDGRAQGSGDVAALRGLLDGEDELAGSHAWDGTTAAGRL